MKRTLKEDLERIHGLTYGKKVLNESFIDNILNKVGLSSKDDNKKVDDPKKADLVTTDVQQFFDNIKKASDGGGLSQQGQGSMTYQKEVESMQIGLIMMGYELPKHGVDGLFGPETASAVSKFTNEKLGKTISESKLVDKTNGIIGKPGQGTHNATDWQSRNAWDVTAPLGSNVYSISNGVVGKVRQGGGTLVKSGGKKIYGDQITINSNDGKPNVFYTHIETNLKSGDSVKEGDVIGTIMDMGGITPHLHIGLESGNLSTYVPDLKNATGGFEGGSSQTMSKATPEMLNKLLELLKQKGVTSEELKKYIDSVTTGGGVLFTDIDLNTDEGKKAYAEISQKFIDTRKPNLLGITGEMMMKGAEKAFKETNKYVPPELALAQLAAEGGIGNNDPNSRPIRTKNPFNVGNTESGANVQHGDVQSGINTYYSLIGRNYLGKGKTANDLVQNFVNKDGNHYAVAGNYESALRSIVPQVNRIAQPIIAKLNKTTPSDLA
jgi:murein DD-endopeptidase MepM/ murein hydrolase activator NlpD